MKPIESETRGPFEHSHLSTCGAFDASHRGQTQGSRLGSAGWTKGDTVIGTVPPVVIPALP
jgi:hypothetical protein